MTHQYIPVVTSLSSNMTYLPGSSVTLGASVDSGSLQAYYQWYLALFVPLARWYPDSTITVMALVDRITETATYRAIKRKPARTETVRMTYANGRGG